MHPFPQGRYMPGMYGGVPFNNAYAFDVNLRKDQGASKMSEERVEVKNIFQGGEGGGRDGGVGGLGAAAMVAALGGRNQGGFSGGWGGDGFGFGGGGGLGALLAVALLGRDGFGRGDFRRGGDDCCENIGQQIILNKLGSIEGSVPLAASTVQNAICESTATLQGGLAALSLGAQQGFSNVKDSVQANAALALTTTAGVKDAVQTGFALTNTNLLTGLCSVKEVVDATGDRIIAALQTRWTAEDQARIVAQANEIVELRQDSRRRADHDELRIQISNTNTAVAAQQQAQGQFQVQTLRDDVARLTQLCHGTFQVAQAASNQTSIIAGNLGAVVGGAQTATQTPINSKG